MRFRRTKPSGYQLKKIQNVRIFFTTFEFFESCGRAFRHEIIFDESVHLLLRGVGTDVLDDGDGIFHAEKSTSLIDANRPAHQCGTDVRLDEVA